MGTRRRAMAVMATAAVLLVGACSSDADDQATTDTPAGTAPDGTAAPGPDDTAVPDADLATLAAEVPAAPSAGCGTETAVSLEVGEARVDTTAGGVDRWYLRQVPSAHDGDVPVPVVMDLHGYSEGAQVHRAMTGLADVGEAEGFLTVTPHGDGPVARWLSTSGSADSEFLGQVLDELEAQACVDTNRIYVTGLSNGAFMTSVMLCDHADRIAAGAPVAGIQVIDGCDPARPVPIATFHGTEDPFVSFEGGFGPGVATLPTPDGQGTIGDAAEIEGTDPEASGVEGSGGLTVPEVTAVWAERDGCGPDPTETQLTEDVVVVSWPCPLGQEVVLYRVDGGGHTWPGSTFLESAVDLVGTTTFTIDANELIWAFFQDHPLGVAGT